MITFIIKIINDFIIKKYLIFLSLGLFVVLWKLGSVEYGKLILPSPSEVLSKLIFILSNKEIYSDLLISIERVLIGFFISVAVGIFFGILAGSSRNKADFFRPIVIIFMGIPPISWVVLAMIWFGMDNMPVIFTVMVTSFPLVFNGAYQGMMTVDNNLKEMMESFSVSNRIKIKKLYIPHIFSYVFPSSVNALAISWKIVIMAELLTTDTGIGALLGNARTQLDITLVFALIIFIVIVLALIELLILDPIKNKVENWRN